MQGAIVIYWTYLVEGRVTMLVEPR